jgi:hypothetical protein
MALKSIIINKWGWHRNEKNHGIVIPKAWDFFINMVLNKNIFEISIFDLVNFGCLLHNVSIFVILLGQQKCKQIFAPPIEHFFIVTKFHQIMTWEKDVWMPSLVLGQMF